MNLNKEFLRATEVGVRSWARRKIKLFERMEISVRACLYSPQCKRLKTRQRVC